MKKILIISSILMIMTGCQESETVLNEIEVLNDVSSSHGSGNSADASIASKGTALGFDGVDDYVEVADDPSLDITNGLTVAAWIYLESYTEWASVVTKGGSPDDDNNYTMHQTGPDGGSDFGRLRFTGSSPALPTFLESNTQIPLNEWHHVAMTYNGETLTFYLDGEPDGGGLLPGPLVPNSNNLFIGADFPGGDEYWHGALDEVKIWNIALKQTHVQASMGGAASPLAKNLVGFWRFNEGDGDTAYDKSKNGNNGALVNGPTWIYP